MEIAPKTINCDVSDGFTSLWRKIFREVKIPFTENGIGFDRPPQTRFDTLDSLLGETVSPDDIRHLLQGLEKPAILVIDETDRIRDKEVTTLLADTIKTLSDHLTSTKIILLSQGLPEFTHSLGLYSSQQAIKRRTREITIDDVNVAIKLAVEKTQQSIMDGYHKATSSPRKENLYARVLLGCALAPTDILGYFTAAAVRDPLTKIMGKAYEIPTFTRHLNEFSAESRGPILQKIGSSRRFRFRFVNPLMQPFVISHGIANDLIDNRTIDSVFEENKRAKKKQKK
jgi:hypothetical protein